MKRLVRATCVGLILAATIVPSVASAQDETAPPVQFTGDLGFVNTSGNSEVTTLNLGERLTYTGAAGWVLGEFFSVLYGETDGEESASEWKAGVRVDREITPRLSAFARGGWERNTFAGISRRFEEALGLAYKVLTGEKSFLDVEAGVSLNQQRSTLAGADNNFIAGRAAGLYRYTFSESAFLTQLVEFLPNLEESDDYRLNSETALVAALSKQIALKLGYVVRYDNLPELRFKKTDRLFTSGIQVNF